MVKKATFELRLSQHKTNVDEDGHNQEWEEDASATLEVVEGYPKAMLTIQATNEVFYLYVDDLIRLGNILQEI